MWNSFTYSFIQQTFNECLLFSSHCSKWSGPQNGEKKIQNPITVESECSREVHFKRSKMTI